MKPGKRNRKGLDMYQTREKIQSIILLLADLICFAVSYFGGGYLWLGGYRKYEDRADGELWHRNGCLHAGNALFGY